MTTNTLAFEPLLTAQNLLQEVKDKKITRFMILAFEDIKDGPADMSIRSTPMSFIDAMALLGFHQVIAAQVHIMSSLQNAQQQQGPCQ